MTKIRRNGREDGASVAALQGAGIGQFRMTTLPGTAKVSAAEILGGPRQIPADGHEDGASVAALLGSDGVAGSVQCWRRKSWGGLRRFLRAERFNDLDPV